MNRLLFRGQGIEVMIEICSKRERSHAALDAVSRVLTVSFRILLFLSGSFRFLADLIDSYEPSRCLRSTNCHLLSVPSCVKSSFASRAFCVSSPNNWNSLPAHIRSFDSLVTFQSRLKSHLFSSAYHV